MWHLGADHRARDRASSVTASHRGYTMAAQATRRAAAERTAAGAHPGSRLLQRRAGPPGQHVRCGARPRSALRQDLRGPLAARTAAARPGPGHHRRGARPQARPHGHHRRDRHGQRQEPRLRRRAAVRADRARRDRAGLRAVAQRRRPPRLPHRLDGRRLRAGRAQPRLADHRAPTRRSRAHGGARVGHVGRGGGAGDDPGARRPRPPVRQRACAAGRRALPQQRGLRAARGLVPGGGRAANCSPPSRG